MWCGMAERSYTGQSWAGHGHPSGRKVKACCGLRDPLTTSQSNARHQSSLSPAHRYQIILTCKLQQTIARCGIERWRRVADMV